MISKLMNTQVVMGAVVVSMTLILAALVATPAMNSVVFATGGGGSHHGCDRGSNGFENSGGRCCHEGGNQNGGCKRHH